MADQTFIPFEALDRRTRRHMAGLRDEPYYDHYPYEQLTPRDVARNLRLQDKHITDLQEENALLKAELYHIKQWQKRVVPILEANGLDIFALEGVMEQTRRVFDGERE